MEILEIWGALLSWFWGGSMSEELDRIMAKFTNKSLISGCWLFLCMDISFISFPSRWFVTLCFCHCCFRNPWKFTHKTCVSEVGFPVPSQLNPLKGNLLNGILPFLPMMLGTGTVSFSTIPMALLVWEFSRIPTARFWILVFFDPRNFLGRRKPFRGHQTKIGAETSGGFVACGFRSLKNHVNLSISFYRH